jgi:hypothetical protein
MKHTTWLFVTVAACLSIYGGSRPANAQQQPTIDLPVNQTTSYKGEEYLLIGDAVRGGGEPVIAISPKDPNTIIVGAMANNHYVEGAPLGVGQERISVEARVKYRNTPGSSISTYAISHDRGRTWTFMNDPFRDHFKMNGTADAFVGTGTDGTLFIGAMNFFPMNATPQQLELEKEPRPGLLFGATDLAWSKDGGKTWSTPEHVMGQANKQEDYGPGVKPEFIGKTPYDRPYLVTDLSTGAIYIPGNGSGGDPAHRETFFRASHDNGKTWGPIYSYDSADYPQGGGASRPAAANGVLGLAYVSSSMPANPNGKCPCVVFEASRDEGKSFERHIVQYDFPMPRGFGGGGGLMLAADPSHAGRFAVATTVAAGAEIQVFLTEDFGKTWKAPVHAGGTPGTTVSKPDMAYSPKGDLALMWLAVGPDQSYSAWSSASHDGGSTFSAAVQVSKTPSPSRASIKYRGNNWDGDDLSSIAVDNDFVHIVWADGRAGFLGAWYARVPLSSY